MIRSLIFTLAVVQSSLAYDYFTTWKGKMYDPNGKEFMMRGVNNAHAWFDSGNRNYAFKALENINWAGANTVRIVWLLNSQYENGLSLDYLDKILYEAKKQKLVAILELHDATGSSNSEDLYKCARWFKDLDKKWNHKNNLILNINEWGQGVSLEKWRDSWKEVIRIIRLSGWGGPIMVDGSDYGQNPEGIIKYGNDIFESDNYKNVVFSIHMYTEWKYGGKYNIGDKLKQIQDKGLAVIVGEFALSHPETCSDQKAVWANIDAWEIMRQCLSKRIGYLGWSWMGNTRSSNLGSCTTSLESLDVVKGDPSKGNDWKQWTFTDWGNALFYYKGYGIKDTSVKATHF